MALHEIKIPSLGEGIIEVTIIRWLVKEGEKIQINTPLADIATDKVDSQLESAYEGVLMKIFSPQGEIVRVGETICIIGDGESAQGYEPASIATRIITKPADSTNPSAQLRPKSELLAKGRFHPPLIRLMATDHGIPPSELDSIAGTGSKGLLTSNDVLTYLANRPKQTIAARPAPTNGMTLNDKIAPVSEVTIPDFGPDQEIEVAEMDRVRQLIARNIQQSVTEIPHATSFTEADLTNLSFWREANKNRFQKLTGHKLTFTVIFIEKLARILKNYPLLNATIDGASIFLKKRINIGMATALENGNLVVPVIKDADQKNLAGIACDVNELASKARSNALLPSDTRGGSFTITNVGQFNTITGIPIINKPEVGIVAVGSVTKQPGVVRTENGYGLAVRDKMVIAMSYDHRLIDGAMAGQFLEDFRLSLENELPEFS